MHAISYQRLSRLLLELFGLGISEGALDAAFRRGKPQFDADVASILARLRRARVVCSDETSVRIDGRTCWNWVFQNDEVVIHVIRRSRGAGVVAEVLDGHRPALWVSDLYSAQQGHAEEWQICLAHQLRDCSYAIEAGDAVFAPRMKALLLRAVVLARRHRDLAPSTRREYRRRLECALDAVMALAPTHRDGQRLRKRYGKLRSHLFTFLDHPDVPAGRVEDRRGGVRRSGGGSRRCLPTAFSVRTDLTPFPVPARQTGHADCPHPAFSRSVRPSLSAGRHAVAGRCRGRVSHRDTRPGSGGTRRLVVLSGASTSGEPAVPCMRG